MAGPAAHILATFDGVAPSWRDLIGRHVSDWHDDVCYILSTKHDRGDPEALRPFVGSLAKFEAGASGCEYDAAEIDAIQQASGRTFSHVICIAAMCNRELDHHLLCSTMAKVASEYNGFADFDILDAPIDELGMIRCEWTGNDPVCWTVLGDAVACQRWLKHPSFHMVK